ncbi:hypothetical protein FDUTEX481_01463 [Tolypothrix sp. PCC 7601]|nr:hypothetical protein FDUTEX481_01463 [Tolypothrix sp. PCC 7601]
MGHGAWGINYFPLFPLSLHSLLPSLLLSTQHSALFYPKQSFRA